MFTRIVIVRLDICILIMLCEFLIIVVRVLLVKLVF